MPKVKTRKAAAKRFKQTGTGKFMRKHANARHLMSTKNAKRRRRLGKDEQVRSTEMDRVKLSLPYGV